MSPSSHRPATLQEREQRVRAELAPELSEYGHLLALEHNLFVRCSEAVGDRSLSQPAVITLVMAARIMGDLRMCQVAAETGYALQAQSIAATVHEVAYATAYLGDSEERASAWVAHENEKKQYPECGHYAVLHEVLPRLGLTRAHTEQEYHIYRQLCWAKHGNPVLQRTYGVTNGEAFRYIEQVPYYSEATVFYARFAVLHAARAVASMLASLAKTALAPALDDGFVTAYTAICSEIERLGARDRLFGVGPDGAPTPVVA